ncbi:MAG: YdcH family protein [Thermoanaerobaculia bacterium]
MSQYDDLKAELIKTDDEFRRLFEEHQQFERRLDELNHKNLLSEDDEMEEKKIKLHKLMLKDHMEQILRAHRETRVSV